MTVRTDVLDFLHAPRSFAGTLPADAAVLWRAALEEFAMPRMRPPGPTLRTAQIRAWRETASLRTALVLGPPGTGKTFLLAWMAAGFLWACRRVGRPCRVLATGFTREAIGNLLEGLAEVLTVHLPGVPVVFIGNRPEQGLAAGVAGIPLGREDLPAARHRLGRPQVVVGTTAWSLFKLFEGGVGAEGDGPTARVFDLVLIDEASQMVVSQGLLSLSGLAVGGRILVAGDDRQLPPVRPTSDAVAADGRALGASLYTFLKSAGVPEFRLDETYRLNAPLAAPVAELFYDGQYRSAVPDRRLALRPGWETGLEPWQQTALDPEYPLCILLHDGPPCGTDNPFERALLRQLAGLLATRLRPPEGHADLDPVQLWTRCMAVLAPHRAQNAALREELAAEPFGRRAVVETVERIQGRERDAILAGYTVSDPEFALAESYFLFRPQRLNVLVTRARSKLVLVVSRRLLEVLPPDEESFDRIDMLREYVYGCRPAGACDLPVPGGSRCRVELWVRGFETSRAEEGAGGVPGATTPTGTHPMPVTRLTYDGDPPTNAELRQRLGLDKTRYLYLTATEALERARRELAPPDQRPPDADPALRFDRVLRQLIGAKAILSRFEQRVCLQRGIRNAVDNPRVGVVVRHDVLPWLEALQDLEEKGEDVAAGLRPELQEQLTNPSLGPILQTLQGAYRAETRKEGRPSFEEAARAYLDGTFTPPPLVVMEGFTYLLLLQRHFVRRCREGGAHVVFVHPHDPAQPPAFEVMDRTYAPYLPAVRREAISTALGTSGADLRLLQQSLFAASPPATPAGDDSVRLSVYRHRHREVAACLHEVRRYLDEEKVPPEQIVIVTRHAGEFQTVLQEEARRLGMQERLRVEPRVLLLTPLGRFALTLYDIHRGGLLSMTADQFGTMILSGWLGADVQRTADTFKAARPQMFDHCTSVAEWERALDTLQGLPTDDGAFDRLPSGQARKSVDLWRRALGQVTGLCQRLFDGKARSIGEHIRRLRDELSALNPYDLHADEKALVQQIAEALEQAIGSGSMAVHDEEFGEVLSGMAREYQGDAADDELAAGRVWVTTPEGLDSAPRPIVFYLGVDSRRVPRASPIPWPFFSLTGDEDEERERYLFLAVVRAARRRLHLSYARLGEDQAYGPSLYLSAAAVLLGRSIPAGAPEEEPDGTPARVALPTLPGKADEYDLHEVALFGLCPYRARLERFDPNARRFRDAFQMPFLAQGVWLDRVFEKLVQKKDRYRDMDSLKKALYQAAKEVRPEVQKLFPALQDLAWQMIRRHLMTAFDDLVDGWLDKPNKKGNRPLEFGVSFDHAPPGLQFVLDVDGRTVTVRTGLRHVCRIGKFLSALPNALTYQHWLLPSYRTDGDGREGLETLDLFPTFKDAVAWWREAFRAALGKEDYADTYQEYQQELARRIRLMQAGQFPKRAGAHCELCPVRDTCLGVNAS